MPIVLINWHPPRCRRTWSAARRIRSGTIDERSLYVDEARRSARHATAGG
ncbi:MAG: hypothetical protein R2692_05790 [Microbacterium sp.]